MSCLPSRVWRVVHSSYFFTFPPSFSINFLLPSFKRFCYIVTPSILHIFPYFCSLFTTLRVVFSSFSFPKWPKYPFELLLQDIGSLVITITVTVVYVVVVFVINRGYVLRNGSNNVYSQLSSILRRIVEKDTSYPITVENDTWYPSRI